MLVDFSVLDLFYFLLWWGNNPISFPPNIYVTILQFLVNIQCYIKTMYVLFTAEPCNTLWLHFISYIIFTLPPLNNCPIFHLFSFYIPIITKLVTKAGKHLSNWPWQVHWSFVFLGDALQMQVTAGGYCHTASTSELLCLTLQVPRVTSVLW